MPGSVLIIDADEDFAGQLKATLEARGAEVQTTGDGRAGLDMARLNIPSAIVVCVELPRMSGYSICAKIKKDPTLGAVALVITSAEATQETFEHHKKLKNRAEEYLRKPFEPSMLADVLGQYIGLGLDGEPETLAMLDGPDGTGPLDEPRDDDSIEPVESIEALDDGPLDDGLLDGPDDNALLDGPGGDGSGAPDDGAHDSREDTLMSGPPDGALMGGADNAKDVLLGPAPEVEIDPEPTAVIRDEEAFSAQSFELENVPALPEANAPSGVRHSPMPFLAPPNFSDGYEEDEEGMTTIGVVPTVDNEALFKEIDQLRADLEAEREAHAQTVRDRDESVANERAAVQQLQSLSGAGSQAPAASRDLLSVKKSCTTVTDKSSN